MKFPHRSILHEGRGECEHARSSPAHAPSGHGHAAISGETGEHLEAPIVAILLGGRPGLSSRDRPRKFAQEKTGQRDRRGVRFVCPEEPLNQLR